MNVETFEQNYRKFFHRLKFAMMKKFSLDEEDAEDLAQSAFLELFENMEKIRSDQSFYTCLYSTAKFMELGSRARSRIYKRFMESGDGCFFYKDGEVSSSALEEYEATKMIEVIVAAVNKMPKVYRDELIKADLEFDRATTTGGESSTYDTTLRTRLHRGRKIVMKAVQKYLEGL